MRQLRRFGLVVALSVALAACAPSKTTESPSAGPANEDPFKRAALWVVEDEKARPFENGTALNLGDVDVEVFLSPYPPTREGSIDLFVIERPSGAPIEGGDVRIVFDMYMPHGVIKAEALPMGGGHYLVPYKLVMPGEWRMDFTITTGTDQADLGLLFRVG